MKLQKTILTNVNVYENVMKLATQENQTCMNYASKIMSFTEQDFENLYKAANINRKTYTPKSFRYLKFNGWEKKNLGKKKSVAVRINPYLSEILKRITGEEDLSEAVTTAICIVAYTKHQEYTLALPKEIKQSPFCLHGNKKKYIDVYQQIFKEIPENIKHFVDIFGGTGLLTAVASKSKMFHTIIYNELDISRYNTINVLATTSTEDFLCAFHYFNLKKSFGNKQDKIIFDAVQYCMTHNGNLTKESILSKLIQYSQLLQGISATNEDGVKVLENYHNKKNYLLMIDPPYRACNGYDIKTPDETTSSDEAEISDETEASDKTETSKEIKTTFTDKQLKKIFTQEQHDKIAELLYHCRATFLYCCRITAPRRRNKNIIPDDYKNADTVYKGMIDEVFSGKKLYYFDCKPESNGTIERIISNHPFTGFKPYN